MSDLLREVDEAVRADNMKRLWDEHKVAIISGITALILGTAAFSVWNNIELKKNQENTGKVLAALEAPQPAAALKDTATKLNGNAQAIAYLNAGSFELKAGNRNQALEAFTAAETASKADKDFRDLATLQKTSLLLDLQPALTSAELFKSLDKVSGDKKSPFQSEAIFLSAFIKGEKDKNYEAAIKDLSALEARADIPGSLKQRAEALQSVYELKQGK